MMELKGKKVLVVGLGKSGLAAALFLRQPRRTGHRLRRAQRRSPGQGHPRPARRGHHGRSRRPRPAHLPPPGPDRRQPRRAARHSRTGPGAQLRPAHHRRTRTGRPLPQGQNPRHHRLQRQNHHHHAGGRNPQRSRISHPRRRQHRRPGRRPHRRQHRRNLVGP